MKETLETLRSYTDGKMKSNPNLVLKEVKPGVKRFVSLARENYQKRHAYEKNELEKSQEAVKWNKEQADQKREKIKSAKNPLQRWLLQRHVVSHEYSHAVAQNEVKLHQQTQADDYYGGHKAFLKHQGDKVDRLAKKHGIAHEDVAKIAALHTEHILYSHPHYGNQDHGLTEHDHETGKRALKETDRVLSHLHQHGKMPDGRTPEKMFRQDDDFGSIHY